ncbi:MAG: DUF1800 domain-containing protein [bacterium]|nr:DUF1800 domain-containing protein [Candidatus Kapabacteria bacterium]
MFIETGTLAVIAGTAFAKAPLKAQSPSYAPTRRARTKGSLHSVADLSPYTPRPDKPWNTERAAHLLRRAGYGGDWRATQAAVASTPQAVVDALLSNGATPAPPGTWTTQQPAPLTNQAIAQYITWVRELQEWWLNLFKAPAYALREKMTLFWHNHFVSEFYTVYVTQYLYKQNALFRQFAFGDFRELTKQVTVDPAMLIYLDGNDNKAGNPNENYSRELLELFALGAGTYADNSPHYTENDIIELARALTGWRINNATMNGEFISPRFDGGEKTLFGTRGNFGVNGRATLDVVDHVFNQIDPDNGLKRAAVFICSKLYSHFVFSVPDMAIVAEMARTLVQNNWNIGPVLRQLLTSEHFYEENVMGAIVKSPADYVLGAISALGLTPPVNAAYTSPTRLDQHDPLTVMMNLSQWLFYHPNVKGWIGGRDWLSSATVPTRIRYAKFWLEPITGSLSYNFDPVAFVKTLSDPNNVNSVIDDIIALLLPFPVSTSERTKLKEALLGGGMDYEWSPDASNASTRIRACLIRLTALAEYQLM